MIKLHKIQMIVLRELLFKPNSAFSKLNIEGLSNDHFSYHLKTLIEYGFVEKKNMKYRLTAKGKEFANTMDTTNAEIEKQPKIGVVVIAKREEKGTTYLLLQKRLKEPYYGYVGFITGKIKFGESILETAKRELKEETGIDCSTFKLKGVIRDNVYLENGDFVEDKFFFIVVGTKVEGDVVNTKEGENTWVTEKEFYSIKNKYYNEEYIYEKSKCEDCLDEVEKTYIIKEF